MTADDLRGKVVLIVVCTIAVLTCALYALVAALLLTQVLRGMNPTDAAGLIPGELWLAAGTQSGVLGALLVNSKGREDVGHVQITQPPGEPVPVGAAP